MTTTDDRMLDDHLSGHDLGWLARDYEVTPAEAKRALGRALTARGIPAHPNLDARVEVARIDRMLACLWPSVSAEGDQDRDTKAVAEFVRLQERRETLIRPARYAKPLRQAYDQAVAASRKIDPNLDAAIVQAGRTIADRVDEATATGQGQEVTKALYLVPHMVNVLRECLATPAARAAAAAAGGEAQEAGGRLAAIRDKTPGLKVVR